MAISKITTNGFNFANTLSRGDFTDSSFGDIVLLENEVGGLLMDSSASGVDVDGHILYNNNESAFFFRDISSTQLSDGAVTLSKISSDTKDQLNEDHIALENEDGNLLLNSSAVSTDEGDRIVYDAIFIDKLNLFNINSFGSSSQVLQVNSGADAFEFANSSQAFATLLSTQTVNNASNTFYVQFNNLNTTYGSTYNTLRIVFRDFRPETANREISVRVSATAGALDNSSSDYTYTNFSTSSGSQDNSGSTGENRIKISAHGIGDGSGNVAGYGMITINGYNDTSYYPLLNWRYDIDPTGSSNVATVIGSGYRKTTSALENVAIGANNFGDNPGIHNGIFKLYGLNT